MDEQDVWIDLGVSITHICVGIKTVMQNVFAILHTTTLTQNKKTQEKNKMAKVNTW